MISCTNRDVACYYLPRQHGMKHVELWFPPLVVAQIMDANAKVHNDVCHAIDVTNLIYIYTYVCRWWNGCYAGRYRLGL